MFKKLLVSLAFKSLIGDPDLFQEFYFSTTTPHGAYANRRRAKRLVVALAQLRYRPAVDMLRRFELADSAYEMLYLG